MKTKSNAITPTGKLNKNINQPVKLGWLSVTAFVVANMIGSGVFTSLGFQLAGGIHNVFALLMLWIVGGIIALCGSLVYGELGAAMPRSGGEYHYLSKLYHPVVGFLSGWISLTIGFAAPVALACMALGRYLGGAFTLESPLAVAIVALTCITLIHCFSVRAGSRFQNVFTLFKVLLILAFVLCALWFSPQLQPISILPQKQSWNEVISPAFAVALIYVSYSYSGWNASAYIAGEIKKPQQALPLSLLIGTIVVTALYVLLNYTFLQTTPIEEMEGKLEIGFIAASQIIGAKGANIMAALIAMLLVSSISSMVFVGPRISQVMGEDMPLLRFLSVKNGKHIPIYAILMQYVISLMFIFTDSFEKVLTYSAFTFNIFTFLTVFGIFIHRRKYKHAERPFKTWGYPVTPIVFLLLSAWTMYFLLVKNTAESLYGLGTIGIGLIIYTINNYLMKRKSAKVKKKIKFAPITIRLFIGWILFFGMVSCNNFSKKATGTPVSEVKVPDSVPPVAYDQTLTDIARFIAGMPVEEKSTLFALSQTQEWKEYATQCDSNWLRYQNQVMLSIKSWVTTEISEAASNIETLFYPFSGPDFLNANIYFPQATEYIMFGLEPHGSIPAPSQVKPQKMAAYLNSFSEAIRSVVNDSFFHTKRMKKNFESEELDGTTPLLLLFLARADKQIVGIKPFRFSEKGGLNYLDEFVTYKGESGYGSGVEISFCEKNGNTIKKIIYFSANIADGGLSINPHTREFLQTIPTSCASFVKSATYLMHKSYFSIIRNTVLEHSDLILQDDSGIKYAYFDPEKWDIQLYGHYKTPIPLFKEHYEADLYQAYQGTNVKPLPFRSGYNSTSNMLLARKKK